MTTDPVDEVLNAYIDHLETGASEPSLDSLGVEDRARAQGLIDLMRAGRGIDVQLSRPSLDALLAGTEFEDWLDEPDREESDPFDLVKGEVVSALGLEATPRRDVEAFQDNVRSDAVLVFRGVRLRLQFRVDLGDNQLPDVDPQTAAGPIFGRFPETVGVVLVVDDADFSSVAIGPYDTHSFIGAPDGLTHPPAIKRPVLPLRDTLKLYVDEVMPDLSTDAGPSQPSSVDPADIVSAEVQAAINNIVSAGRKARTPAKKEVYIDFEEQTTALTSLVRALVHRELDPDRIQARIDELTPSAA